ncbi:jg4953 [Pararge aegeria aegeria]|uniref:Jg4953 protein n=1 Tax=Pararge aegeria aegeria TaxID=348720 RepID=A0A8S4SEI9_9NEOP|nr:jg4953 [Pararge aegeria aegeria]
MEDIFQWCREGNALQVRVWLDDTEHDMNQGLHELAVNQGQDLKKIQFKDQSWLGLKTRSRDATLSRHKGININELALHTRIAVTPSGETWRGRWQKNDIVAKIIAVRECTPRIQRDFNEEFPKLRIFSHPNILPVVGCCVSPPSLVVISQHMSWGSLYALLHGGAGGRVVVDAGAAVRLARDVAAGMAYLHSLQRDRVLPAYHLNSKHIMIDEDLTARINMADAKFSFQERGRVYAPAWMAPEALLKPSAKRNWEAADMWSFAVLLWELATREVSEWNAVSLSHKTDGFSTNGVVTDMKYKEQGTQAISLIAFGRLDEEYATNGVQRYFARKHGVL